MASLSKKKALGVLALMLLDGEEKARIKRRNRRVWVRGWIARRQEMGAFHRIVRRPQAMKFCPHLLDCLVVE